MASESAVEAGDGATSGGQRTGAGAGGAGGGGVEIVVNNVVCSFSTRCHLNLRKIATQGIHVEYKKENSIVNMRLRKPYTTATVWSSGKITCVGAKSETDAYKAARRYCRLLQKMQFKVKLCNYRVVNVLATSTVPWTLDVARLANEYQKECSYEPELHPGATFKLKELKTTLKLFATGSITLTAPSVQTARQAVEQMYPLLEKFKHASSSSAPPAQTPETAVADVKPVTAPVANQSTNNAYNHLQFTSSNLSSLKTNNAFSNPSTTAAVAMATTTTPTTSTDSYFNTTTTTITNNGSNYHHLNHNLSHSHLYHHTNDLPSSFEHHDFYASAVASSNGLGVVSSASSTHGHLHHHHHHLHTNFYHQHSAVASSHQLFAGGGGGVGVGGSASSLPMATTASSLSASSSQPNNWFYDNLIIEPVDDFLP